MSHIKDAYEIRDDLRDNSPAIDRVFLLLFVFTILVRVFQSLATQIIDLDSYTIIETAKTFGDLGSLSLTNLAVMVHPLFPFLMAVAWKCGIDYETAGKALSILFGSLTVFPVYLTATGLYGRTVGRYSAFLFAIHPYLFVDAAGLLRDSTSIFFVVAAFSLAWKGLKEKKDRFLILSGSFAALAYLTKPEGLFCIIAVLLFIWMRDLRTGETTLRARALSTLAFSSVSLTIAASLIIVFSLKSHGLSVSLGKPLEYMSLFSQSPLGFGDQSKIMGGMTTGRVGIDMALVFLGLLSEAIWGLYLFFLAMNVMRFWTGKGFSPTGRYYLFVVAVLLVLDFVYFTQVHVFSRRYFLPVVILLMPFAAYGMRLFVARFENLLMQRNQSILLQRALMAAFIGAVIIVCLINGSSYWEDKKLAIKVAGRYIASHFGPGPTILTDDPRIAYYAGGAYTPLTEDALREAINRDSGLCPYDFIVLYGVENLPIYEKYRERIMDVGFVCVAVPA